jgi:hypothetical protein
MIMSGITIKYLTTNFDLQYLSHANPPISDRDDRRAK